MDLLLIILIALLLIMLAAMALHVKDNTEANFNDLHQHGPDPCPGNCDWRQGVICNQCKTCKRDDY